MILGAGRVALQLQTALELAIPLQKLLHLVIQLLHYIFILHDHVVLVHLLGGGW